MLTKLGTLILGIISEQEINAYELIKVMEYIHINRWFQTPDSTIYSAIKSLQKKGYITGRDQKAGNMPEKTIYAVTNEGKQVFLESLEIFLGNTELDYVAFNIAAILICHLEKDTVLKTLDRKKEFLIARLEEQDQQLKNMDSVLPIEGKHAIRHMQILTKAELESVEEFMRTVESTKGWNYFISDQRG